MSDICCIEENQLKPIRPVYGEFIRTFTFGGGLQEPIVQPGGSVVFPVATVSRGVTYVDEDDRVGLLVPRGTYLVSFTLVPGAERTVNLLVNGNIPTTSTAFQYGQSITTTDILDVSYLIKAPLRRNNLISIVNASDDLFALGKLPNSTIGDTSVITKIRVQRLGK